MNRRHQPLATGDVLDHFDFTVAQWTGLLVKLDRLDIIELLPGNRGRPLTARNFRWRPDGPSAPASTWFWQKPWLLKLFQPYRRTQA